MSTRPFAVVREAEIAQRAYIQSDTATTSSSGSNYWTLTIKKNNSTTIFTKTTNGAEIAQWGAYDLGAYASLAAAKVSAGTPLQFTMTATGSPTDLTGANITVTVETTKDLG